MANHIIIVTKMEPFPCLGIVLSALLLYSHSVLMSTIIMVLILKIRKLKFRSYFAKIMSIGNNTAEPES